MVKCQVISREIPYVYARRYDDKTLFNNNGSVLVLCVVQRIRVRNTYIGCICYERFYSYVVFCFTSFVQNVHT